MYMSYYVLYIFNFKCYFMQRYIKVIDCGAPLEDSGVIIEPFNDTIQGALITFRCDNSRTAMCGSDGEWFPNPSSSKEI